jgi:hypothetical protein
MDEGLLALKAEKHPARRVYRQRASGSSAHFDGGYGPVFSTPPAGLHHWRQTELNQSYVITL